MKKLLLLLAIILTGAATFAQPSPHKHHWRHKHHKHHHHVVNHTPAHK